MSTLINKTVNASDGMDLSNRNLKMVQIDKERKIMAFVNEYASDEDFEKYDLNGIWDKYHPARKGKYYLGQRPGFTIDRERNIFFIRVRQGRFDESNRTTALLWINGRHILVDLEKIDGLNKGIIQDTRKNVAS